MKKMIIAAILVLMVILLIPIGFTLLGRDLRKTEINNAMISSMENAMELLLLDEGKPQTEVEWIAMFKQSVAVQIESDSDLTIRVIDVDMDKGYLASEGILTFRHPIGTIGTVSSGRLDIILEEYVREE